MIEALEWNRAPGPSFLMPSTMCLVSAYSPNIPVARDAQNKIVSIVSILMITFFAITMGSHPSLSQQFDPKIINQSVALKIKISARQKQIYQEIGRFRERALNEYGRLLSDKHADNLELVSEWRIEFLKLVLEIPENKTPQQWSGALLRYLGSFLNQQVTVFNNEKRYNATFIGIMHRQNREVSKLIAELRYLDKALNEVKRLDQIARERGLYPPEAKYDPKKGTYTATQPKRDYKIEPKKKKSSLLTQKELSTKVEPKPKKGKPCKVCLQSIRQVYDP
jgi:hypothetical protein